MLEAVLSNWWGIIVVVALILLFFVFVDRKIAKEKAYEFVLEIEKHARSYGLQLLHDRKRQVKEWYLCLPGHVRLFVSKKLWEQFVDFVYEQLPQPEDSAGGG